MEGRWFVFYSISIHALLAESDPWRRKSQTCHKGISIHALLAESDAVTATYTEGAEISIHALLAESDRQNALHGSI